MKQRFTSRKDAWIGILFLAIVFFPVVLSYFTRNQSRNHIHTPEQFIFSIGIVECIILLLLGSLWFGTWYEIDSEYLYYRVSLYKGKITVSAIHAIKKKSKQSSSNFAFSKDLIMIKYNTYDDITISPLDKEGFINALKLVNPNIVVEG
jgi:hypothetical protein